MAAFLEGLLAGKTWSSELLETLRPGFKPGPRGRPDGMVSPQRTGLYICWLTGRGLFSES